MHTRRLLAAMALAWICTLAGCGTAGFGPGSRAVVLGGVPPGADVTKEEGRGR